jgi:hypothetical protein
MTAAIICPGPSARLYSSAPRPTMVVGVNRAATVFPCDVWAAGDTPMVQEYEQRVIGTPLLLTSAVSISTLLNLGYSWRGDVFEFESLREFCDPSLEWDLFTATSALIYTAAGGATHIRVYGADRIGTQDFDGVEAGGNRSPERWELEGAIWENRLVPWLATRGVTIHRHSA